MSFFLKVSIHFSNSQQIIRFNLIQPRPFFPRMPSIYWKSGSNIFFKTFSDLDEFIFILSLRIVFFYAGPCWKNKKDCRSNPFCQKDLDKLFLKSSNASIQVSWESATNICLNFSLTVSCRINFPLSSLNGLECTQ